MIMGALIPLDEMTIEEKLAAMERLWDDLCRNAESVPSPEWHQEVLSARENRVREGKAVFSSFDNVKARIRKSTE